MTILIAWLSISALKRPITQITVRSKMVICTQFLPTFRSVHNPRAIHSNRREEEINSESPDLKIHELTKFQNFEIFPRNLLSVFIPHRIDFRQSEFLKEDLFVEKSD